MIKHTHKTIHWLWIKRVPQLFALRILFLYNRDLSCASTIIIRVIYYHRETAWQCHHTALLFSAREPLCSNTIYTFSSCFQIQFCSALVLFYFTILSANKGYCISAGAEISMDGHSILSLINKQDLTAWSPFYFKDFTKPTTETPKNLANRLNSFTVSNSHPKSFHTTPKRQISKYSIQKEMHADYVCAVPRSVCSSFFTMN